MLVANIQVYKFLIGELCNTKLAKLSQLKQWKSVTLFCHHCPYNPYMQASFIYARSAYIWILFIFSPKLSLHSFIGFYMLNLVNLVQCLIYNLAGCKIIRTYIIILIICDIYISPYSARSWFKELYNIIIPDSDLFPPSTLPREYTTHAAIKGAKRYSST